MFTDVEQKIKKKNKILFNRESACLQELRRLVSEQTHLSAVLWAFDCLKIPVEKLEEKYPGEPAFRAAFDKSLLWAHGEIKMPEAKRAILDCHAVAKRLDDEADIALCHALGQGCGTVHVETHAVGLVFYELTAIVVEHGYKDYEQAVSEKIEFYNERLSFWKQNAAEFAKGQPWAEFLTKPHENREKLLLKREEENALGAR